MKRLFVFLCFLAAVLFPPPDVLAQPYTGQPQNVWIVGSGTSPYAGQPQNVTVVGGNVTNVLPYGDSTVQGTVNGKPGGQPGWRGPLALFLRTGGDDHHIIGPYADVQGALANAGPLRAAWFPSDAKHGGHQGDTISQIQARIASDAALLPPGTLPHVILSGAGTNDVTAGTSSSAILALLSTYQAQLRAQYPAAAIVHLTLPHAYGNSAPQEVVREAVNASLVSGVAITGYTGLYAATGITGADTNTFVLDVASDFGWGEQGTLTGFVDVHPYERGHDIIARRIADFLLTRKGGLRTGLPFPRPIIPRASQAAISIASSNSSTSTAITSQTFSQGAGDAAMCANYYPTLIPGSGTPGTFFGLFGLGGTSGVSGGTSGWRLWTSGSFVNTTTTADLIVAANGALPLVKAVTAISINKWVRICVTFHAAEGIVALWVDGVCVGVATGQSWNITPSLPAEIAYDAGSAFTAPGLYDQWEIVVGTLPRFDSGLVRQAIEKNYFDGTFLKSYFPSATSYAIYRLADGTGSTFLEEITGNATSALSSVSWSAAGTQPHIDRRTGVTIEW